jgi:hypothetical protein
MILKTVTLRITALSIRIQSRTQDNTNVMLDGIMPSVAMLSVVAPGLTWLYKQHSEYGLTE